MNEQRRRNLGVDIAQSLEDLRPTINAVRICTAQPEALPGILSGNCRSITLPTENIRI